MNVPGLTTVPGLTSAPPGHANQITGDTSRFPEHEDEGPPDRPPQSKSASEIISSAFRGIRKIAPTREDLAKPIRQASQHSLRRPSEPSLALGKATPPPPLQPNPPLLSQSQHARNLSLQDSLEKPLPEPPASESPPLVPRKLISKPLQGFLDTIEDTEMSVESRTGAMDSAASSVEASRGMYMQARFGDGLNSSVTSSQSSLASLSRQQESSDEDRRDDATMRRNGRNPASPSPQVVRPRTPASGAGSGTPGTSSGHLSGLMCNVHWTTGREPRPLVGATTTILGDKLYVFGGRVLSRSRPSPLTADLYELDLISRHWTKLETSGDIPAPRYFHSMCALGDTKVVCYGGMSPVSSQPPGPANPGDQQAEITVLSDIHIYDIPTRKWSFIPTHDSPQGRYAHCACILPSSATFASHKAPLSALQHNPPSSNPNEGRIGINIDGAGGAEMVVVGGQDGANHYIEEVSLFNLRSLKWTSTQALGKSCGAYRSVVAPLPPRVAAKVGKPAAPSGMHRHDVLGAEAREPGSSMLIYSNYNFLDVKLELQIRSSDGTLSERQMSGTYGPPGLRFPNGGVIDTHFVVSGTYLTSSKQEYALWALDLRTLTWSRIDAGGSVFSEGSWNRGILWNRRNTFVILGNRERSLVDDYNHRRINFTNVCMVELEAFGFYDNPRKTSPMSGFVSASSPYTQPGLSPARRAGITAGGRFHSRAAEELGEKALVLRELSDMDILCIGGERIPVNSRIVARRWGPYFVQLLREGAATQDGSDAVTLRTSSAAGGGIRSSTITITPNNRSTMDSATSVATTVMSAGSSTGKAPSTAPSSVSGAAPSATNDAAMINSAPTPRSLPPNSRPRCLYLPHTYLTIQALLHFLYTSSLPQPSSPLCTPQILCSLLQLARPYRVDGLLEAVVERLHNLLDSRNAAAVFNATAMAAGGGRGIDGTLNPNFFPLASGGPDGPEGPDPAVGAEGFDTGVEDLAPRIGGLRINTSLPPSGPPSSGELSASSVNGSEWSSDFGDDDRGVARSGPESSAASSASRSGG